MLEMDVFKQDLIAVRRMLAEAGESLQIDHLREQLQRYRAENEMLRAENERLRRGC